MTVRQAGHKRRFLQSFDDEKQRRAAEDYELGDSQLRQGVIAVPAQSHSKQPQHDCHGGVSIEQQSMFGGKPVVPQKIPAGEKHRKTDEKQDRRDTQPIAQ